MSIPTITLSGPADLLAAIPHMLGFQPESSLVTVSMQAGPQGSRVGLVTRVDLPTAADAVEAAESLLPALIRESPSALMVVGYGTITEDVAEAVDMASTVLIGNDLPVRDRVVVADGRWLSLDCSDHECCPEDGSPLPGSDAAVGLEFAWAFGSAPAPSRDAVVERVTAGSRAAAVGRECDRQTNCEGEVTIERGVSVWGLLLDPRTPVRLSALSDGTLALAGLSLHADGGVVLRDTLIAWLCPGTIPLEAIAGPTLDGLRKVLPLPWRVEEVSDAEQVNAARLYVLDRLVEVAACLPDEHASPALTLLAQVAWSQGSGVLASVALERALTAVPNYRLAQMMHRLISLGMPCPRD